MDKEGFLMLGMLNLIVVLIVILGFLASSDQGINNRAVISSVCENNGFHYYEFHRRTNLEGVEGSIYTCSRVTEEGNLDTKYFFLPAKKSYAHKEYVVVLVDSDSDLVRGIIR